MLHIHLTVKFRAFGRDITRCKEEWDIDLGAPLPAKEHVNWSRFGVTLVVGTS